MSTTIDLAFVKQYEREVHHVFQKQGGIIRQGVRTKDNVKGKSTTFQKIGKGVATTKARHGKVTPMNQDHTPIEVIFEDFYAPDYVDKLDEAKINHDERAAIAQGGAWALGRKVDDQLFTKFNGTSSTGVTWTVTSPATIRNALIEMCGGLDNNDVPNDGQRYGALTPKAWQFAMTVKEFQSADFVGADGQKFKEGAPVHQWKRWNGVMWTVHTGLPGKGTATAKVYTWHKFAAGYGTAAVAGNVAQNPNGNGVSADVWWDGSRQAHLITHCMSGGGALIDDTGVIEGTLDDTAALPST